MPLTIHEQADDWIAASVAEGLSPEERRALDEHLAACEPCRKLREETLMMNEALQHDFPAAVGPLLGFETRLVSGFRRRQERGGRARLLALMGWLMRLRGVQVAGVAALLLTLVQVGKVVTGREQALIDDVIKNVQIESKFVEITNSDVKELNFDIGAGQTASAQPQPQRAELALRGVTELGDISGNRYSYHDANAQNAETQAHGRASGESLKNAAFNYGLNQRAPAESESLGRKVFVGGGTAGAGAPTSLGGDAAKERDTKSLAAFNTGAARSRSDGADKNDVLTISGNNTYKGATTVTLPVRYGERGGASGSNTYSGATTITAGNAKVSNEHFFADSDLPGLSSSEHAKDAKSDGFIHYGSPVATVIPPPVNTPSEAPDDPQLLAQAQPPTAAPAEAAPAPTPAAPDVRKLIRNARAEMEVASFDAAVDSITAAASQDGGYVDTKNSARGGNGKLSGTLVVKVLPDNLERFLQRLRPLGEVKNQTVQTEDITKAYFDTDARLRNSKRMEDRLLKMLDEVKGKMAEVLQVEKELGRVRSDIEQMQGELKLYDSQVRYATVNLRVYEKDLNQPAAFLLRETANLSLLAYDVEKTFAEARRIADAAKAQVLQSNMERDGTGRVSGTLRLLVAPDAAAGVIAQVKALGRVENYTLQDERVAQNGSSSNNAAGAETAKVERAPVTFVINISHDEQTRKQVGLTLVAKDVDAAFDKARSAVSNAGGETVNSNVTHPQSGHSNATLAVRVPAKNYANLLEAFKALGRTTDLQTQRAAGSDAARETDDGPTLITLNLADAEPSVQQTSVSVLTPDVEKRLAEIKQAAAATPNVEAQNSTFSRQRSGSEQAALSFRLPLSAYPAFIDRVRALGEVKDFTVQRQDRPAVSADAARGGVNDASAPVEISLRLYSEGQVVDESSGLGATLRRTFAQGAGALMWSVQMIGVAVAFLAPWAVALALALWLGRRLWLRRRAARLTTEKKAE